jgi:hypothetical protein
MNTARQHYTAKANRAGKHMLIDSEQEKRHIDLKRQCVL